MAYNIIGILFCLGGLVSFGNSLVNGDVDEEAPGYFVAMLLLVVLIIYFGTNIVQLLK